MSDHISFTPADQAGKGRKREARRRHILRVTVGYGTGAALWIVLSDTLLSPLLDSSAIQGLSTAKGLLFVIVTTLLLFFALRSVPDRTPAAPAYPEIPLSGAAAPWPGIWIFLFAVAATLATILVRIAIPIPLAERPMMVIFILPIILSAATGGIGPGLVATLLAALCVSYFSLPPLHSLLIANSHDLFQWSFLIAGGVLVSILSEVLHRQRRQSEAMRMLYQDLVNAQPAGIYRIRIIAGRPWNGSAFDNTVAAPFTFETISDTFCDILGVSRRQLEENPGLIGRLIHPDDFADFLNANREANAKTTAFNWEGRILKNGEVRWVHLESLPRRLEDGNLIWTGILSDISERKRTEIALGESETTYSSLVEHMLNSVVHARVIFADDIPMDMEYLAVNPAFATVTGIEENVVGRRINEVIPGYGRDNPESLEVFGRVAVSGIPTRWEHYLPALDRWFSFSIYSPARGEVIIITDNITEQKKAEVTLRENEARLRAISDNLPDGYIYQSGPGPEGKARFLYVSAGVTAIHGLTQEEVLSDASLLYRQVDPSQVELLTRAEKKSLVSLSDFSFELHICRPDQTWRWLHIRSRPRRKPDGQLVWDGVATDITAQKGLEAQLFQAQKMEFVGRLAGGVAHDFNNMLTVIGGHAELALAQTPVDDPRHQDLLEIQKAAQRSTNLTHQLLAFARRQAAIPKVLDLNDTLGSMLKLLRRLIGEDIDLAWVPGHNLGMVKVDPSQIDQLLANLAVNARDAIKGVGKVTIETANRYLDLEYCTAHPEVTQGEYVELAVSDTGCGMDGEVLEHLFEPFYTTKEEGKGTGLGLATVYGIVRQNKGGINVYSEPGKGTTFRIYLPRHAEVVDIPKETAAPATPPGGSETILLVEDDPAILDLSKRIIEKIGYRVLPAVSAEEALKLAEEYDEGNIDLLITDVVMPKMNGRELAERLKKFRPGLKCLFMSGYTADVIAHQGVLDEGICFLAKPFSAQEMAVKIREALEVKTEG